MNIEFTETAAEDYAYIQKHSPRDAEKIRQLIASCCQTPFSGPGKPEALRHNLSGYWSRRINMRDRMVYACDGSTLTIIALRFHYNK